MSIRLGIIGTGRIAKRFVFDAKKVEDIEIICAYNPKATSARLFAESEGIELYFSDLELFFREVDAVYIASPHETHYLYARKAIEQGKHVLCEKPMCLSAMQVKELYGLARSSNVILQEAIKTAYFPGFMSLTEIATSGMIGEIVDVEACFTKIEKSEGRELSDTVYGGSITELGSYVLLPIVKLLGTEYTDVQFMSVTNENGVDTYSKIILNYGKKMALGKVGLAVKSEGDLVVAGTKGYIYCRAPWWLMEHFEIRDINGKTFQAYDYSIEGSGLQYELECFKKRTNGELTGTDWEKESVAIISIIEKFLKLRQ